MPPKSTAIQEVESCALLEIPPTKLGSLAASIFTSSPLALPHSLHPRHALMRNSSSPTLHLLKLVSWKALIEQVLMMTWLPLFFPIFYHLLWAKVSPRRGFIWQCQNQLCKIRWRMQYWVSTVAKAFQKAEDIDQVSTMPCFEKGMINPNSSQNTFYPPTMSENCYHLCLPLVGSLLPSA